MTKRRETYTIDMERRGLRIRDSIMEEEECLSKFIHFYDSNSFSLSLSVVFLVVLGFILDRLIVVIMKSHVEEQLH